MYCGRLLHSAVHERVSRAIGSRSLTLLVGDKPRNVIPATLLSQSVVFHGVSTVKYGHSMTMLMKQSLKVLQSRFLRISLHSVPKSWLNTSAPVQGEDSACVVPPRGREDDFPGSFSRFQDDEQRKIRCSRAWGQSTNMPILAAVRPQAHESLLDFDLIAPIGIVSDLEAHHMTLWTQALTPTIRLLTDYATRHLT